MPQPGMPDFAKMAKEATVALNSGVAPVKSEPVTSKVKVASSENGVPAPEHAVVDDTTFDEPIVQESIEVNEPNEVEAALSTEPVVAEVKSQEKENVLDIPDDAKVRIKVDGVEQVVTHKEYKDILRKNATLTQRSQQFAKSREEFNTLVQQTLAQLEAREQALANRPQQLDPVTQTILDALKGKVAPPPKNPDDIVSFAELQAERQKLAQEFEAQRVKDRQDMEQMLVRAAQGTQVSAQNARERQKYMDGLNGILGRKEFTALNELNPNLSAEVMYHVKTSGAQSLEEALEQSEDFIKDRFAIFKKHTIAQKQDEQAKTAKEKMESNNGATPTITRAESKSKVFVGKNGKLDWAAMKNAALAQANSMA